MDMKTSFGSCPVATGSLTLTGRAVVVSLSILGPFLFPTFLLERDSAVVDQYLKGETMMVHQVEAASSSLVARVSKTAVRGDQATERDPELVFTSISLDRSETAAETGTWG